MPYSLGGCLALGKLMADIYLPAQVGHNGCATSILMLDGSVELILLLIKLRGKIPVHEQQLLPSIDTVLYLGNPV